jgi:carbon monoxide dehydrogenase subunit G
MTTLGTGQIMELHGEQMVRAPRLAVWEALNNPTILSRCIPGCEEVNRISDSETHTRVAIKIGPVRARFAGKIFMSDIQVGTACTLRFEGTGGAAGFAQGTSRVSLSDVGEATRLAYSVEASVGGKLGQIGGRLIDSSAKKMADEFFAAFDSALTGGSLPAADAQPNRETSQTSQTNPLAVPAGALATRAAGPGAAFPGGGFGPELYRAFWFALGVASTLLLTHWPR